VNTDLPIMSFQTATALRQWLDTNHGHSGGILIRIYKKGSGVESVSFEDVLDEGLCFGWSESKRLKGDDRSYLQQFTPRRHAGTNSQRNRARVERLKAEGRMTQAGITALAALGG
jgi:uncharacterized protein YdeI (YjbR/CyaY-like superfamily)